MIHPATELRAVSDVVGLGVFATAFIPRGTILWTLDPLDQLLAPASLDAMMPAQRALVDKYSYVSADGLHVLCWDLGRYMNHSCEPAARGMGELEIAVRDIRAGDELTCEYATLNIAESFACACGASACRGTVRPDDAERHWRRWDEEFIAASRHVRDVQQPLWPLVENAARNRPVLDSIARGWRGERASVRDTILTRRRVA